MNKVFIIYETDRHPNEYSDETSVYCVYGNESEARNTVNYLNQVGDVNYFYFYEPREVI